MVEEPVVTPEPVIPEPVIEEPAAPASSVGSVDEITQDEFEKLLDELHGKGSAPGASEPATPTTPSEPPQSSAPSVESG
ncbi:chemotaxis protein CheA, partial [Vibrio diabolicus]